MTSLPTSSKGTDLVAPEAPPRPALPVRLWPWVAALLTGIALSFCYPPWNIEPLLWTGLLPLMAALWLPEPGSIRKPGRRGFFLGYAAGLAFFLTNLAWLHTVTIFGAVMISLYLALYFGAWGAFAATIARPRPPSGGRASRLPPASRVSRLIEQKSEMAGESAGAASLLAASGDALRSAFLAAAAWVALEWLRGIVLSGFGWNGLGVALHANLPLIQICDVVGVAGLAFVPVFCATVAYTTLRRVISEVRTMVFRPHLDFAAAVLLVVCVFLYGAGKLSQPAGKSVAIRTLIVQGNIPLYEEYTPEFQRSIYRTYWDFTEMFVTNGDYDLVIWPESALPANLSFNEDLHRRIAALGDFNYVFGTNEIGGTNREDYQVYNSIALLPKGGGDFQTYRKTHLVPFGEFIPLKDTFPFLKWIVEQHLPDYGQDLAAGTEAKRLRAKDPDIEIIPLICFEDTVGRVARKFVAPGPQLIVNATNDGWFNESPASRQHLANALFRCVELRRPMARAANSGVSAYIDPFGNLTGPNGEPRILRDPETGNTFLKGCLPGSIEVPLSPPMTFYARFGDVFAIAMLAVAAAAVIWTIFGAWIRRRGH